MHESWAVAADLLAPLGPLTLRAELYRGRLLRGLGGGGIGQNFDASGAPLLDQGGWAQLDLRATPAASLGGGCGVADPRARRPATGALRTRNVACEAHLLFRPAGPLFVGIEARRMETTWVAAGDRKFVSDHFNLALGFEF